MVVSDASELLFEDIKKAERTTKTRCSNMPYLCNHQLASHVHKTPAYFYLFKLAHSARVLCSSLLPPPESSAIHLANVPSFGGSLGLKSNRVDPKFCPHRERLSSQDGRPRLALPNRETFTRVFLGKTTDRKKRCLNKNVFSSIKKYAAIRSSVGGGNEGTKSPKLMAPQ